MIVLDMHTLIFSQGAVNLVCLLVILLLWQQSRKRFAGMRRAPEAMNNIAKYSRASRVKLRLQEKAGTIEMIIRDNGQGFDLDTVRKGLGLATMRERAQLSGGIFDLQAAPGKGTRIHVSWPQA